MFIRRIKTVSQLLTNMVTRIYALSRNGILYLKQYGLRAFVTRVWERLKIKINSKTYDSPANANVANIYMEVYKALINTASGHESTDYVPISQMESPIGLAPIKLVAFYLPQFHPIPENDEWWGRGFTEWTNVSKAVPQFVGHYQPHLPGELGFYDLRVPEVQKRQIELACKYGIHGFAFYYYWFNGKRLLEKPMDIFFADKENKFPFCIFWANENWTRRWDGKDEDILIAQNHSPESDLVFIRDIEPYLRDERYIRIDGKPVLLVYRVQLFPEPAETARRWREYCRATGIGEIYLIAGQVYGFEDPRVAGFDAAVEFPPHNLNMQRINDKVQLSNPIHDGPIFHYRDFANFYSHKKMEPEYELFKTVAPNWDNEPRKPGKGYSIAFSTPSLYQRWLMDVCKYTLNNKQQEKRFVFVNAWNEWAEGAHLEPDRKFGYGYLQATQNVLELISDPKYSVVIYQMGKVGSMSLYESLIKTNPDLQVFHVHLLNNLDQMEVAVKRKFENPVFSLLEIEKGRKLLERIKTAPNHFRWNVITMVRDPLRQRISAFFENLPQQIPDFHNAYRKGKLTAEVLKEYFFQFPKTDNWFDNQLKPVFNIDVFETPFPSHRGFQIYNNDKASVLLIRTEDLNRVAREAIKQLLDIDDFLLSTGNKSDEKYYAELYELCNNMTFPKEYIEEVYSTRICRHFYTQKEIQSFTSRWKIE
jgi:lipopolysaccharide biosynthesis protein